MGIPYVPPAEYDLRVSFTRTGDHQDVVVVLPVGRGAVAFGMGCAANSSCGFGNVKGQWKADGPAAVKAPGMLVNGRRYSAVVYVRKDRVAASIDGRLVAEYRTDGSDLSVPSDCAVAGAPLAVGSLWSPVTFHSIEIAEVTGTGKPLAGGPATPQVPPDEPRTPSPSRRRRGKRLFED